MAKKVLKTRTQFTSTLNKVLYSRLQELSQETDVPISRLLDKGVDFILREYKKDII